MKRSLLSLATVATAALAFGQARVVMNNAGGSVYMVFNNPAVAGLANQTWLVIENSSPLAFAALPNATTSAGVRSEDEFNMIRWQIGATVGTYTIPFNSPAGAGVNIPLTYQKTSAGVGAGSVVFSTYNFGSSVPNWNNYVYRPSDVTHVSDYLTGSAIDSGADDAVDRFWIMDTQAPGYAYTTKPNATLSFTNVDAEITNPGTGAPAGNAITAGTTLIAQRFNFSIGYWADYFPPAGAFAVGVPPGTHTVSGVSVPSAQFYRSWTLADLNNPLPVELVSFTGNCIDSRVELEWSTASETDNSYFEVGKSSNGIDWVVLGTVNGAGTSAVTINYSYVDATADGSTAYYRLRQVDINGNGTYSNVITAGCTVINGTDLLNVWDDGTAVILLVTSTIEGVYDVLLNDIQGKAVTAVHNQAINKGITYLSIPKVELATGLYMVRLQNESERFSRKVLLN